MSKRPTNTMIVFDFTPIISEVVGNLSYFNMIFDFANLQLFIQTFGIWFNYNILFWNNYTLQKIPARIPHNGSLFNHKHLLLLPAM